MIMDNFVSKLEDCILYNSSSFVVGFRDNGRMLNTSVEDIAKEILKLFTPKLDWTQENKVIWRGKSPFHFMWTVYFHSDGYWEVVKADKPKFQGTLEECKKECERLFMEMYLNTCK